MIAVIFEVEPREGCMEAYLQLAAGLKQELEAIDGFVSIERFHSLTQPGRLLSLSFWRDEAAVRQWRETEAHRAARRKRRWAIESFRRATNGALRGGLGGKSSGRRADRRVVRGDGGDVRAR